MIPSLLHEALSTLLLMTIAAASIVLTSCSDKNALSKVPGQIIYETAFSEAYIPSTNTHISYERGSNYFEARSIGHWLGDTIVLKTTQPWPGIKDEYSRPESTQTYYYKWSPSKESLIPCGPTQLQDSNWRAFRMEESNQLALCYSTGVRDIYRLVKLDSNLTFQYKVAQFGPSMGGKKLSGVFLTFGGIIHQYMLDSMYYQTIKGDSLGTLRPIGEGKIEDVSRQGILLAYMTYSTSGETLIIRNLLTGRAEIVDIMTQLGNACFSPDGQYLAYTEIGQGLFLTAKLHIYDLRNHKTYDTGIDGAFGELLWTANTY